MYAIGYFAILVSQKSVTRPLKLQSPLLPHLSGSFLGPPTSPVTGFRSPSNSGGAPRQTPSMGLPLVPVGEVASTSFIEPPRSASMDVSPLVFSLAARSASANSAAAIDSAASRCSRSNSACSSGGKRNGDGRASKEETWSGL